MSSINGVSISHVGHVQRQDLCYRSHFGELPMGSSRQLSFSSFYPLTLLALEKMS